MRFDVTSPPRQPIVAEVDRPNDMTGAYIVLSPHCFHLVGLTTEVEKSADNTNN